MGFSTVLYISNLFSSESGEFFPISHFNSLMEIFRHIPILQQNLCFYFSFQLFYLRVVVGPRCMQPLNPWH